MQAPQDQVQWPDAMPAVRQPFARLYLRAKLLHQFSQGLGVRTEPPIRMDLH